MGWFGKKAHELKNIVNNDVDIDKSYSVQVTCRNCTREITVRIRHGQTVENWNKRAKCGNCKRKYSFVRSDDYF